MEREVEVQRERGENMKRGERKMKEVGDRGKMKGSVKGGEREREKHEWQTIRKKEMGHEWKLGT